MADSHLQNGSSESVYEDTNGDHQAVAMNSAELNGSDIEAGDRTDDVNSESAPMVKVVVPVEDLELDASDDAPEHTKAAPAPQQETTEVPESSAAAHLPSRKPVQSYFDLREPINFTPVEFPECKNSLLSYNFTQLKKTFDSKPQSDRSFIEDGTNSLRSLLNQLKTSLMVNDSNSSIDWDQWCKLANDELSYDEINLLVQGGIPDEIRTVVWQVVSKSNNLRLNDHYLIKKSNNSIHERQIKKDITRNSFYNSINQYNKIQDVFNVLKVYSELHPEIGYNQSFIFILSPIILKLPELESFNLFHTLLEDYGAKSLFDKEMTGLQVILYKFDRLLEVYCPLLYNHLIKQGIKSNMYAGQWFLTFFSYKFPLEIILKIYDSIILEGLDFLLKISLKLMMINEQYLLGLKFDQLVQFLNNNMFDILVEQAGSSVKYNLKKLFGDLIDINPNMLKKFELEFEKQNEINKSKVEEITKINLANGKLRNEIKYLQMNLANLNKDHLSLVQSLINLKIRKPELIQQNADLTAEIETLKRNLNDMKDSSEVDIPSNIESQIENLLVENKAATEKNIALEDQVQELLEQDKELTDKLKGLKKTWFWNR